MKYDSRSKTKTYWVWRNMLLRASGKNGPRKKDYSERGISVCEEWKKYENFLRDMGHRPDGMSLDRINNDGSYCKENCRWADKFTQRRNSRYINKITHNGETKILRDWAKEKGIKETTLWMRLYHYKWSIERALGGVL